MDKVEAFDNSAMEQPSIAEKIAAIAKEQESLDTAGIDESNRQIAKAVEDSELEVKEEPVVEEKEEIQEIKQDEVEQEAVEAYDPNYKFKVYDEEKEFDDFMKPFVNKDNEEKIRDLYTRAHGIDGIKRKLDGSRQELATTKTEMNQIVNEITYMGNCIKQDNLDEVFRTLQLDQDKIEKWMVRKLQMTPEQREDYEKRLDATRRASFVENQYSDLNKKYNQIIATQTQTEIQSSLSDPNVKAFVDEVNQRLAPIYGENGFMKEIGNIGVEFYNANKYDLPVKDVVDLTLRKFGYKSQSQSVDTPTIKRSDVKPVTKIIVNNKNTIPSVGGSGSGSPSAKTFTSIDQLVEAGKRIRKEGR